jgi:hypothetical protein
MGLRLTAVWALLVAFDKPVPASFEGGYCLSYQNTNQTYADCVSRVTLSGAFIKGSEVLSWAANNSAKMGLKHDVGGNISCWYEENLGVQIDPTDLSLGWVILMDESPNSQMQLTVCRKLNGLRPVQDFDQH